MMTLKELRDFLQSNEVACLPESTPVWLAQDGKCLSILQRVRKCAVLGVGNEDVSDLREETGVILSCREDDYI